MLQGLLRGAGVDEVADAAGFERAGRLEVFEFEEDAAVRGAGEGGGFEQGGGDVGEGEGFGSRVRTHGGVRLGCDLKALVQRQWCC